VLPGKLSLNSTSLLKPRLDINKRGIEGLTVIVPNQTLQVKGRIETDEDRWEDFKIDVPVKNAKGDINSLANQIKENISETGELSLYPTNLDYYKRLGWELTF
jgi:hypothetical protein